MIEAVAIAEETSQDEVVKEEMRCDTWRLDCFDKIELGYNEEAKDVML